MNILVRWILCVMICGTSAQINFGQREENPGIGNTRIVIVQSESSDDQSEYSASGISVNSRSNSNSPYWCTCFHTVNTDGSGVVDPRIVNAPAPSGVICPEGQTYGCIVPPSPPSTKPPPQKPDKCGFRKIIPINYEPTYGDAEFGEYPWLAVILSSSDDFVGTGALVDKRHVVTVAHRVQYLVRGSGLKVRLGEWNVQANNEPYSFVEIEIDSITIHPNFNSQSLQNDVAVIKLKDAIHVGAYPHIGRVCLPDPKTNFAKSSCFVAGWGKDAFKEGKHPVYLKEVNVNVLDSNDCEDRLRKTKLGKYFQLNRQSFICAGGEKDRDACTGDGGAPLVCADSKGQFFVAGLVAWGIACGDKGVPGVYVNIPNYVEWIQSKMK